MTETYILKHKNRNVALIELDPETAEFYGQEVLIPEELPVLCDPEGRRLHEWLDARAIPEGRAELGRVLSEAGCQTPQEYLVKNLALSLTDLYWICPASISNLTWEEVSLFSHTGKVLTFHDGSGRVYYTSSDAAVGGSLPKKAFFREDGWYLRKEDEGGSGEGLRNVNEAFASLIHQRQGFSDYTPYTLLFDSNGTCSACECKYFTNENRELMTAYDVTGGYNSGAYNGRESLEQFIRECVRHGLAEQYVRDFLDYQILTDFLITNTDRHWGNFGILRDPDSLRFIAMAPIFDSGTSMVCDEPYVRTRRALLGIGTHGVEKKQEDQLRLVRNRNLIALDKIPSESETEKFYEDRGVGEEHARQIAHCYSLKAGMLYEFQAGFEISVARENEQIGYPPYKGGRPNPEHRP